MMTLIKKPMEEKKKITFETLFGVLIVIIVLAAVALFFPMLIYPLLK